MGIGEPRGPQSSSQSSKPAWNWKYWRGRGERNLCWTYLGFAKAQTLRFHLHRHKCCDGQAYKCHGWMGVDVGVNIDLS